MNQPLKFLTLLAVIGLLSACSTNRVVATAMMTPPTTVVIDVIIYADAEVGECYIASQTTSKTCPFIGSVDPTDVACQKPSPGYPPTKRITWNGKDPSGNDVPFTLEFNNGDPFVNTNSNNCDLSTASNTFTCVIRVDNPADPLKFLYKYDIVESPVCRLDPGIYLIP